MFARLFDSPGHRPDSYRDSTTLSAASSKEGFSAHNPLSANGEERVTKRSDGQVSNPQSSTKNHGLHFLTT